MPPKSKVCIRCGGNPQPLSNFYHRPDNGKRLNVCKKCRVAQVKLNDIRPKVNVPASPENQITLYCKKCNQDRPESDFTKRVGRRGYITPCKPCKRIIEKERRRKMPRHEQLFDEGHFSGIEDFYNERRT